MDDLNTCLTSIDNHLQIAKEEAVKLASGTKAAAPRLRAALQAIKLNAQEGRVATQVVVNALPKRAS